MSDWAKGKEFLFLQLCIHRFTVYISPMLWGFHFARNAKVNREWRAHVLALGPVRFIWRLADD